MQIVVIKGLCSGIGSLIIGFARGEKVYAIWSIFAVIAVGFVAYGLSIFFYVYAQRNLGAARTSAYYAIAPFIGVLLSLIIFSDMPKYTFYIALALMAVGAFLSANDEPIFKRKNKS
jgi:drug/metabolite transporter (DMT)-like permease